MGNNAHAVDTQKDGTAHRVRIEVVVQRHQRRKKFFGRILVFRLSKCSEQFTDDCFQGSLESLESDIASETICDNNINVIRHEVTAFDIANEVHMRARFEKVVRFFAQSIALARFFTNGEQSDSGVLNAIPLR